MDVFNERKAFVRLQIKSKKLQTALMILMTKRLLPSDIDEMKALIDEFNDLLSWKVMSKVDELARIRLHGFFQHATGEKMIKAVHEKMKHKETTQTVDQMYDIALSEVEIY
jgi:hypothetical protein